MIRDTFVYSSKLDLLPRVLRVCLNAIVQYFAKISELAMNKLGLNQLNNINGITM